jgi:hypothetical protein
VVATSLFAVCGLAFLTVFLLLTFLAVVMHLITTSFPEGEDALEPAMVAAIASSVATLIPGARVVQIEEER